MDLEDVSQDMVHCLAVMNFGLLFNKYHWFTVLCAKPPSKFHLKSAYTGLCFSADIAHYQVLKNCLYESRHATQQEESRSTMKYTGA
jgi:hypothetical protein